MNLRATRRLQDGRYVLLGLLREGGEAVVWRALDTRDGSERALKIYPADDGGAEAAARELALARRVAHPHVVRVDDGFVEDGSAFVVMELAEGSLAERVALLGPLSPREAAAALAGPLAALEAAHAAGVVHRDVKPHNLLVFGALDGTFGEGATVKLGDFGIAQLRAEGTTRTRSGTLLGSLPFLSPEQRRDPRRVGPATDVYAASVTLAWLVTGEAPGDLYLPETLAELAAKLRARGVPEDEARWVVGRVEAGGRLAAGEREGLGVWAVRLAGGQGVAGSEGVEGRAGQREEEGLTPRNGGTATKKAGGGAAGVLAGGGGSVAFKVGSWGGEGAEPPPRNAPPLGRARWAWGAGAGVVSLVAIGVGFWRITLADDAHEIQFSQASSSFRSERSPPTTVDSCENAVDQWLPTVQMGPEETRMASIGDVDRDGMRDAIFINQLAESVSIWWGERGVMPRSRLDVHVGRSGFPVQIGDVDGDGIRDLVVALSDAASIGLVLGRGGRQFQRVRNVFQGPAPADMVLLDWDADRRSDLVFTEALRYGTNAYTRHANGTDWAPHAMLGEGVAIPLLGVDNQHVIDRVGSQLRLIALDTSGNVQSTTPLRTLDPSWSLLTMNDPANGYALDPKGNLVRLPVDASLAPCVVGRVPPDVASWTAAADLDGDSVIDLVGVATCHGCTSNHVFARGMVSRAQ